MGNIKIFWGYLMAAVVLLVLRFAIYICVLPDSSPCAFNFLKTIHFDLYANPQYQLGYFLFLLTGFVFIRGKWLWIYSSVILINILAFIFIRLPLPW